MALFSARVFQVLKRSLVLLPNGPVLLNLTPTNCVQMGWSLVEPIIQFK